MKDALVPIDFAGRIVLPKNIREELAIKPGDLLRVTVKGTDVTLSLNTEKTGFVKKGKALVFSTAGDETLKGETVHETLMQERALHGSRLAGKKRNP